MFDIDHLWLIIHYLELSLARRFQYAGERGSFYGELTANDSVSERLISLSCDCGLYSVPNIAEAVVMDAPRRETYISKGKSCNSGTNADRKWKAYTELYSLRRNSSRCIKAGSNA